VLTGTRNRWRRRTAYRPLALSPSRLLAAPPGLVYICAAEARVRASSVQTEEVSL